jgi:hypothetical protein
LQLILFSKAKLIADTAVKFVGGQQGVPADTLAALANLGRFLGPGHHLLLDLKARFARQVLVQGDQRRQLDVGRQRQLNLVVASGADSEAAAAKAMAFCADLVAVAEVVTPGDSRTRRTFSDLRRRLDDCGSSQEDKTVAEKRCELT